MSAARFRTSEPSRGRTVRRTARSARPATRLVLKVLLPTIAALPLAGLGPTAANALSTSISVSAGSPQTATINTAFATGMQVTLGGISGPVAVVFTAPTTGPSGIFTATNTNTVTVTSSYDSATSSGVATAPNFDANDQAGTFYVDATIPSVSTAGVLFVLTSTNAGISSTVSAYAGTPQSAEVGTAYVSQLQAIVTDALGNPVHGANVTFSVATQNGAGATFTGGGSSVTEATNYNGVAETPTVLANTVAGAFSVVASTSGVSGSATYTLTNVAGPATTIVLGAGASQSVPVNTKFPIPLAVTVEDAYSNKIQGDSVVFSAPSTGASGNFAQSQSPGGAQPTYQVTVLTDSSGIAVAPTFSANGIVGGYVVTAYVAGVTVPAAFSLVNQLPSSSSGGYWLVSADGGVFAYGDALFYGAANTIALNSPVVGMSSTPDGKGYWLVSADGGVFAYGDALFYGAANTTTLPNKVVSIASDSSGTGYLVTTASGQVIAFGSASAFGVSAGFSNSIVDMHPTSDGNGYWLVDKNGLLINTGDASFQGSAAGLALQSPIVGVSPVG